MEINKFSYLDIPATLSPNAPIISNINLPNELPELSPILNNIPDYKDNIPVVTIIGNKTVKLDGLLSKVKSTTVKYKQFLRGLRTVPTFPDVLDLRNNIGPIRDQGSIGSCVSFASSAMKEWQERVEGTFNGYLSPAFIYVNRINHPREGMFLSNACDILANKGTCIESSYSYNKFASNPTPNYVTPDNIPLNAINEANKYRTSNSVLIQTINDLKTALYLHGPCIMGTNVYYPYYKHMWVPTNPTDPYENWGGGHSMAIVGYNNNGFIIRNSWSELWNPQNTYDMRGHDYLPYEHFKYLTQEYEGEVWSTTDLIQYDPTNPVNPIYIPPTESMPPTSTPTDIINSDNNVEIILGILLGIVVLFNIIYFIIIKK